VFMAQASGPFLRKRVAIPLAVRSADEGGGDFQLPFADLVRLTPQIGEAKVDIELEQIDAGGILGHGESVGPRSDDMISRWERSASRSDLRLPGAARTSWVGC